MILQASARALPLDDETVQCVVTSPPYWGLRQYAGEQREVWGGDPEHAHDWCDEGTLSQRIRNGAPGGLHEGREVNSLPIHVGIPSGTTCSGCGAWYGALGLEPTPDLYVQHIVEVFREVRRVLRKDGTLWLNLGDSYAANRGHQVPDSKHVDVGNSAGMRSADFGLKPKDLVGIPWMVAFALRADGWYLRSDIIWAKPNPMPESVTDRPTKAHEYLFLLAKSERYYYDADAIKETLAWPAASGIPFGVVKQAGGDNPTYSGNEYDASTLTGRNRRTVWTIATQPYAEAHFATYPEALVEPCILAGSRVSGKRCDCADVIATPLGDGGGNDPTVTTGRAGFNRERGEGEGTRPITRREQRDYAAQMLASPHRDEMAAAAGTAFSHYTRTDRSGARPAPQALLDDWTARRWLTEPQPCEHPIEAASRVLDPFNGSGTTGVVALRLGREYVGTDMSREYLVMAERRLASVTPVAHTIEHAAKVAGNGGAQMTMAML